MRLPFRRIPALAIIAALAAGCSSETGPSPGDPASMGEGTIDPGAPAFLVALEGGGDPARRVRVDLVGDHLVVDADRETISVDVAVVNRGAEPLFAPLVVRIGAFRPPTVQVTNPDVYEIPNQTSLDLPPPLPWGFDYTELLGDDGTLDPGEASGAKAWTFHVPGLGAFSFAARVDPGVAPGPHPHVGGFVWNDLDRDGVRDRGEGPGPGAVQVDGPEGFVGTGFVSPDGRWFARIESPGLHRVTYFDPTDGPLEWIATTPNPIEVVLPPDPDGHPQSFDHADFGVTLRGVPVPVLMTERRPDQIPQDAYDLRTAILQGDVFRLEVQYAGGCRPAHPLVLWASSEFRGSDPAETWMLLAHDDLGDRCEAAITRSVAFDLDPVRQAHIRAFGEPGVVTLHFLDFRGNRHTFEFGP